MNPTKSNRNLPTPMSQTLKRSLTFRFLLVGLLALMFAGVQTAQAVNSIAYTNQLTFSQSGISSTSGVPLIYIPSNPYAVGDLIYFNGTTTANNPFTSANRYYVIYSSGNNIKVATTFNGTAANAVNSITAAATAQQHPDWLSGANWFGGAAPNDNNSFASFPSAGGGATPTGGVVISGNVTTYGLGYANSSQDLEILSGSSNNLSLYPITFATADSTTPKITSTNASAGVIFLGNSSQAASLKINGTQGLIFNAGPGGAVTGSGTAATSSGPGKDIRVFNTVNWADFSGGVQIERGQVSQQNGASVLPSTQNLTVGNNQTTANNLLAALSLNARDCTVGALNGVALGRIFNSSGTSIFTVGNNNADGNYAGSIGYNFDGTFPNANLWLHKAGTGTQTISGPIAGTNTTVTVDAGTLVLSGINIYKGATIVNAGKLVVTSAQLTTNTITVASGAMLDINVSGTSQLTPATLTLSTTTTTLEFLNLASTTTAPVKPGTLTLSGTTTVNINSGTLAPGNSYPLVNWTTINGAGGFVLGASPFTATLTTNGSTLTLNVSATTNVWTGASNGNWDTNTTGNWTGGTGVYADGGVAKFDDTASGTTAVNVNQALVKPGLVLFNNSSLAYSVTATTGTNIGGVGSLTKSGTAALTLTGPNTYSGGTTISAGQLNINYGGSSSANSAIGTGALTIGGGQLDNTSAGDVALQPAIAQNWNGDFGYVGSVHNLNLGSGAVTLAANRIISVTNNILTVGGTIADGGAGYTLTKNGTGTLALAGANTFSGGLTLNAGAVQAGNAAALGTGPSQLGGGMLDLNGNSLVNSNNINSSSFVLTNSSASAGAWVANSKVNQNFTIGVGTGSIAVARLIDTGSPLTVTKVGTGTLTFNGAGYNNLMAITVNAGTAIFANTGGSTSDRGVTLNGGTIKLGASGYNSTAPNANLIGDNNAFTINGGTFDLNGWNETVATVAGTNGVILNNAAGTTRILSIGGDNGTNTFSGSIQNGSGVLALTVLGTASVQTLAGANTYTGGTTITNTATLRAGTNNVFPTAGGDVGLYSGATLDLNGFNNAINGLNGVGTVDNVTNSIAATLTVGYNGDSGSFSGTIQNTAGALALVKVGTGTQALNGANNYSGTTTVSNGTLVVGTSLAGAGAVTVVGPGVLNATNTAPSIAGAVTLVTNATLSLLDNNIGTLALNGGLTLNNSNVLKFDISSAGCDSIAVSGSFAQSGNVLVNINQVNAPNAGTYTLISGVSGINLANFVLGNTLSGYTLTLSADASDLYLNVTLNAPATAYWHNRTGTTWIGHTGANYNWDTDQSSGLTTATFPAAASDVLFAANAANNFVTTLGADFGIKSLTFNVANNVIIAGTNVLTLGGAITVNSGAGTNTISVTNVVLGVDQNLTVADAANTLTISSPISGGHALNINPTSGLGTVALSGSSTFTGNTTITAGTLALKNPTNTLPDAGAVNINGGILSLGTNSDTVGAVTLTSGIITGSSGLLTGSSYNFLTGTNSANLGGSAALTVNGGPVFLAGNSTYSGGTTISSGTLQLGASNALGSGSVTVGANVLDLNGQTIANVINFNGAGTLQNNGASAATVTANANVTSGFTIDTTGGSITTARLIGTGVPRTLNVNGGNTLTFNGAGHNNLIALVLGADSQAPTVICANNGGHAADRGVTIDTGTLRLAGPGNGGSYPNADLINDTSVFQMLGTPSVFDLNGWNETVATVYGVSGAVIQNSAAGTNSTLTVGADNATSVNTFSGTMQDGGGVLSIAKTGSGVQILNGTSTYSGSTTINNGQLQVTAAGASPASTFVINTNGGLTFDTDTAFYLGGLSGTGNDSLLNLGSSAIALTVGANNASTTYSGALSDGGAGAMLTKVGTGTLTLSGTNNYSGMTTVSNGAVIISPNYVAGYNFTVNEGAVLGVSGNSPSTSAQIGTLTPGISGSGSSTLLFTSLPVPTNAPMTVTTLAPVGGVNSVIISNTAVLAVGTYNLINYTTLTGSFGAFTLGTLPAGTVAHLNNNTASTPKVIQLVVTAIAPQIWSGAVSTNWDIATTANWKINGTSTNYADFSPAQFDDSVGSGATTVNFATNVQPSIVTVSNLTKNYTFTTANGSGITGATGLTKNGTGTLTLVNVTNSFTGGVAINAGAVVLSSATLGTNNIANNASLIFSNGAAVFSAAITGSGTVAKNGTGTLELAGTNSFSGGLVIKSGTVQDDNTNALGAGSITLGDGISANSATLLVPSLGAAFGNNNPIVVAPGGGGVYKIQFVGNPDYHLTGGIALSNALTLSVTANGALFVDAPITSGAGNPQLTVDGGGTTTKFVYLTANNSATFTGNIVVTNNGKIKSGNASSLSAANAIALDGTASVDNGSQNLTLAGLNDFGAGGGAFYDAGSATLTLGGSGSYAFSGAISLNGGLLKNGAGSQTLSGANTYSGPTVVSNGTLVVSGSLAGGAVTVAGGTLAGTGVLNGATTVQTGGTLSPGGGGIGTLTVSNSLTLAGNTVIQLNKSLAQSNDVIAVSGALAYGGSLSVTNLGGALVAGDSFRIFKSGGTGSIAVAGNAGSGLNFSFSDGLLSVVSAGPSGPATLTNSISGGGGTLALSWPAGQGWVLQIQTNSLTTGLGTNWTDISGSTSISSTNITLDASKPTVFYRLKF